MHELERCAGTAPRPRAARDEVLDRLDVVVGARSMALTSAASVGGSAPARRSTVMDGVPAAAQLGDAGLGGQRQEPERFDAHPLADEPGFAEERPQLGGLAGVAAVDGEMASSGVHVVRRMRSGDCDHNAIAGTASISAQRYGDGMTSGFRVERDSMGELQVPGRRAVGRADAARGRELPDQRAALPRAFIRALGLIKWAAARRQHRARRLLPSARAAIQTAALEVAAGQHDAHFPIDVFQTGSGTSTQHECQRGDRARSPVAALGAPCIRTITSTWARAATT